MSPRPTPDTRYTSVGDGDVAYAVFGDGPIDLVFLAGVGSIDTLWDYTPLGSFWEKAASFCRVITFDRRGVGLSDPSPGEVTSWELWVEDLVAVLDAVGSERVAIYAQVDAGPAGITFAATHPERTSALILGTTTACYRAADDYPAGLDPAFIDPLVDALGATWGTPDAVPLVMPSLVGNDEEVALNCRIQRSAFGPRTAVNYYGNVMRNADVRPLVASIQAPTLILQPTAYALIPVEHGKWLAEHISGAKYVEIDSVDTWFVHEAADHALAAIAEFLTGESADVDVDRVLTTVLFTDIVESTSKAADLGDKKWHSLLDSHDKLVRDQLRRFRGVEVKTTGDGFLASFDGRGRAIRCAEAIRDAARSIGVEIRAGLHTGECERRGDDLSGLAVHIGARVSSLAGPGQILISSTVRDLVAGSGIETTDEGEHDLKGVPGSWRVYAVRGSATGPESADR